MRQFRHGDSAPYASRRWTPTRPRGPGPSARCHACGAADHWAAYCPRRQATPPLPSNDTPAPSAFPLRNHRPGRPTAVHFAGSPPLLTPRDPTPPATIDCTPPADAPAEYDQSYLELYLLYALDTAGAASSMPTTAIVDTGSPPDVVGEAWLNQHRPVFCTPLRPTPSRVRFGKDTPPVLGTVGILLCIPDTGGFSHTLRLPAVLVVASEHIPLIVGLHTCSKTGIVIDPVDRTVTIKGTTIVIQCSIHSGHLCLPPPPTDVFIYYNAAELSKIHRQFGHTGADRIVAAFPPDTFSPSDVAILNRVVQGCDACQTHALLPRRPKYGLPSRPAYFNRAILLDVFSVDASLPKVLDVTCMDTDFGSGSFLATMRAEIIVGVLYLSWLTRYGLCETAIADRGSNLHAPAVVSALHSMGIHFRVAPTEAPWSIGKSERHHGPLRAAFQRARAESPTVHADLLLALAYKARNDAPRASGASPTTAVFGERPRLMVGDNTHWDPSCAAHARAAQAANAAMEAYTIRVRDRLQGALSHPGTWVPYVTVGQHVLLYRDKKGWEHVRVSSIDGKDVYVQRGDKTYSAHESRVKPYVDSLLPAPLYE